MSQAGAKWPALVLAAGRGPDDPMAKAFGVSHKCLVKVAGSPMLARVVKALRECARIGEIFICIEDAAIARKALGGTLPAGVRILGAAGSAASSVLAAVEETGFPLLVTTADHALLDTAMLETFLSQADKMADADLAVALARREVVEKAFPDVKRTWLRFGPDELSACNLFALKTPRARKAAAFWRAAEKNRKQPWKIAWAFGLWPLIKVAFGLAGLEGAFAMASRRLGLVARPVLMPMATAAVDVDKPSDHALVEAIVARHSDEHD